MEPMSFFYFGNITNKSVTKLPPIPQQRTILRHFRVAKASHLRRFRVVCIKHIQTLPQTTLSTYSTQELGYYKVSTPIIFSLEKPSIQHLCT